MIWSALFRQKRSYSADSFLRLAESLMVKPLRRRSFVAQRDGGRMEELHRRRYVDCRRVGIDRPTDIIYIYLPYGDLRLIFGHPSVTGGIDSPVFNRHLFFLAPFPAEIDEEEEEAVPPRTLSKWQLPKRPPSLPSLRASHFLRDFYELLQGDRWSFRSSVRCCLSICFCNW